MAQIPRSDRGQEPHLGQASLPFADDWERTTSAWLMSHEHVKRGEIRKSQTSFGVKYLSSHSKHNVGL